MRASNVILVTSTILLAASTLALVLQGVPPDISAEQHQYRTNRTWTVRVEFLTCGEVEIVRIDRLRIDLPDAVATVMPNQPFVLQWSVQPAGEFMLAELIAQMSQERYLVRVYTRLGGQTGVKFFYFSPYGASTNRLPAMAWDGDLETVLAWFRLHDYSPVSEHNPEIGAFEVEFDKLTFKLDAGMDMVLILGSRGCQIGPSTDQTRREL